MGRKWRESQKLHPAMHFSQSCSKSSAARSYWLIIGMQILLRSATAFRFPSDPRQQHVCLLDTISDTNAALKEN